MDRIAIARREVEIAAIGLNSLHRSAPLRDKVAAAENLAMWQAMLAEAEAAQ